MISEIYDAAIAAGASEEKARKAAEAMTVHENPLFENTKRAGRLEVDGRLCDGAAVSGGAEALSTL